MSNAVTATTAVSTAIPRATTAASLAIPRATTAASLVIPATTAASLATNVKYRPVPPTAEWRVTVDRLPTAGGVRLGNVLTCAAWHSAFKDDVLFIDSPDEDIPDEQLALSLKSFVEAMATNPHASTPRELTLQEPDCLCKWATSIRSHKDSSSTTLHQPNSGFQSLTSLTCYNMFTVNTVHLASIIQTLPNLKSVSVQFMSHSPRAYRFIDASLLHSLAASPTLEELTFSSFAVDSEAMEGGVLAKLLQTTTSLRRLSLSSLDTSWQYTPVLLEAFRANRTLTHLALGLQRPDIPIPGSLRRLIVRGHPMPPTGLPRLFSGLTSETCEVRSLAITAMNDCSHAEWFQNMPNMHSLRSLRLDFTSDITSDLLPTTLKRMPHLRELRLRVTYNVENGSLDQLCETLIVECKHLHTLALLDKYTSLRFLEMHDERTMPETMKKRSAAIMLAIRDSHMYRLSLARVTIWSIPSIRERMPVGDLCLRVLETRPTLASVNFDFDVDALHHITTADLPQLRAIIQNGRLLHFDLSRSSDRTADKTMNNTIDTMIARATSKNRSYAANWSALSVLIAFVRANNRHTFRYSILPLLSSIVAGVGVCPHDEVEWCHLDRILSSAFVSSHFKDNHTDANETTSVSTTATATAAAIAAISTTTHANAVPRSSRPRKSKALH